jgi:hypothetical protein
LSEDKITAFFLTTHLKGGRPASSGIVAAVLPQTKYCLAVKLRLFLFHNLWITQEVWLSSRIFLGRLIYGIGMSVVTILCLIWFLWPTGKDPVASEDDYRRRGRVMLIRSLIFIPLISLVLFVTTISSSWVQPWEQPVPTTQPTITPAAWHLEKAGQSPL